MVHELDRNVGFLGNACPLIDHHINHGVVVLGHAMALFERIDIQHIYLIDAQIFDDCINHGLDDMSTT